MTETLDDRWTSRLHLRRITLDDVAAIAAIESDPRAQAHRPDGPVTSEQGHRIARGYVAQWGSDSLGYWAVEVRGTLIGVAGLGFMTFTLQDCWNIYARFSPDVWGLGYATEAVEQAMELAFTHTPRLPVVARVRPDDVRGMKLAVGAGLERRPELDRDGLQTLVSHWIAGRREPGDARREPGAGPGRRGRR